jgi:hypothetical protein
MKKLLLVFTLFALLLCFAFPATSFQLVAPAKSTFAFITNALISIVDYGVGVPSTFTGLTASGEQSLLQKGNLNYLRLRPQILNEHAESSRSLIDTVTAIKIVGQVFKASQDNINGLNITLLSAPSLTIDDFNDPPYDSDPALQAVWIESNATYKATRATVEVGEGNQSMELDATAADGDTWSILTTALDPPVASVDLTGFTGSLMIFQDNSYAQQKLRFYIGDGSFTASAPIVVTATSVWQTVEIAEIQLVDDPGGSVDRTAITSIGFRVEQRRNNGAFLIDDLKAAPAPGSINLKLWNMGATIPVSLTTSIDDGTQYTKLGDAGISGLQVAEISVEMVGGFRQYHLDSFVAGPALEIPTNEILIPENYYALTINYVDTDVQVYGPDTALDHRYNSGFSFTAPDEATAITSTGADEDLQFCIFSTQDVFVVSLLQIMDDVPGSDARALVNIEDSNMVITGIPANGVTGFQNVNEDFWERPYEMEKGGKFELNYNDDSTDSVSLINLIFGYVFVPPDVNG